MSKTVKEHITVSALSKFGFKVGEEFINLSKQLPESDKTKVVPGASFDAEIYVSDSGKRYLNKILSASPQVSSAPSASVVASAPVDAKKFVPKFNKAPAVVDSEKMSKADWSAKDRSQLIGGLSHDSAALVAALISVGSLDTDGAVKEYKKVLEAMLKVREELK